MTQIHAGADRADRRGARHDRRCAAAALEPERRWTPLIDPARYDRRADADRAGAATRWRLIADRPIPVAGRRRASALARLTATDRRRARRDRRSTARRGGGAPRPAVELLAAMAARARLAFWGVGSRAVAAHRRGADVELPPAGHRGRLPAVRSAGSAPRVPRVEVRGCSARRVFGPEPVDRALGRVQAHLDGLGYADGAAAPEPAARALSS